MMEPKELANKIAEILDKRGAIDIQILEVGVFTERADAEAEAPIL